MKKIIYIVYLGLLLFILAACEKETIAPDAMQATVENAEKRGGCQPYSYNSKSGTVMLETIHTGYVLVGFDPALTLSDQQQLLSRYNIYDTTDGEVYFDSGVITVVKLKAGTSCAEVEKLNRDLQRKAEVNFALPVFNPRPPQQGIFAWEGLTNEFIVVLQNASDYSQLEQLAAQTNTHIVTDYDDVTFVLSADKNSNGNALDMSSYFNLFGFVASAEPNFLYELESTGNRAVPEYRHHLQKASPAIARL